MSGHIVGVDRPEQRFVVYLLLALCRCRLPRPLLPVVSAGIWALLHFATNPDVQRLWTFLPFYVLTVALLSFPKTRSNLALLSVSAVHGIMNLVICLVTWWLP